MTFEVDGVRVAVSLQGREVTVDVRAFQQEPAGSWREGLGRALAERGFDLARDGGNHPSDRRQPGSDRRPDLPPTATPRAATARARTASAATSDDLHL